MVFRSGFAQTRWGNLQLSPDPQLYLKGPISKEGEGKGVEEERDGGKGERRGKEREGGKEKKGKGGGKGHNPPRKKS